MILEPLILLWIFLFLYTSSCHVYSHYKNINNTNLKIPTIIISNITTIISMLCCSSIFFAAAASILFSWWFKHCIACMICFLLLLLLLFCYKNSQLWPLNFLSFWPFLFVVAVTILVSGSKSKKKTSTPLLLKISQGSSGIVGASVDPCFVVAYCMYVLFWVQTQS